MHSLLHEDIAMIRPLLMRTAVAAVLLLPAVLLAQAPVANVLSALPVLVTGAGLISLWLNAMLLMMGVTIALLARLCPSDRRLPYLGGMLLSAAAWGLLSAGGLEPHRLSQALSVAALAGLTLCALRFVLSPFYTALPAWLSRSLAAQLLLAPLSVWLLGAEQALVQLWSAVLALELLLAMIQHARLHGSAAGPVDPTLPPSPSDPAALRALLVLLTLAVAALLTLQLAPGLAAAPPLASLALLWATALLLIALGLLALAALARARQLAEIRHAQAEHDMHARVAEVELSFGTLVEQKLEQVTERERKRIAADLHDDLGAKLLTIVHTSESDRISTLAREALEEMRLSVRGLTGKPVQLLDALGDWRAEVVSRLGQANILAEWESPAEDIIHTLPARAYVQTTRIFREAVSNIIKHSGGTHCNISCKVQDGDFLVIIQDNGQGIPAELDGRLDRGHGMASMKSRAKQMHGQCLVESGPGWGTVIRLTIPL
jgi:two-component system sensor histidine kinase UhpB